MVILPHYKGGQTLSLFDPVSKGTFQTAKDLDVYAEGNLLRPHKLKLQNITLPTVSGGTDLVFYHTFKASDGRVYVLGQATISSTNNIVLWATSTIESSPTWVTSFRATTGTSSSVMDEYKDRLYFGYGTTLKSFGLLAGTKPTFTVTIASPGVFTVTGHGLGAGDTVVFTTTGALPTGLSVNTVYYVISAGLTSDEFEVSATLGGSAINTSGSQSGTHSISYASKTISSSLDGAPAFIRTHKGLGKVFIAHNKKIASYNDTAITLAALTLEQSDTIVGIEPLGRFVIVGVRGSGSTRSRFLVWDGTSTTIDDTIDLGEVGLQGFRIVNGLIEFVCQTYSTASGVDFIRLMTVTLGGTPKLVQQRPYSVTTGSGSMNVNAFGNFGDLFFYGFDGSTYDIDLGIYAHGTGDNRIPRFPSLWRLVSDGSTTGVSIRSIQHNGDNLILIWSTLNASGTFYISVLYGGSLTATAPSTGIYQSNAFPLNKGKLGKIQRIVILHKNLPSSCGFTLKIKHYGHYPVTGSVASADSFVAITTPQGSGSSTGKTQSTDNAAYTIIEDIDKFKEARFAQIEIDWDEVSSADAAEILFPIFVETVDTTDEF